MPVAPSLFCVYTGRNNVAELDLDGLNITLPAICASGDYAVAAFTQQNTGQTRSQILIPMSIFRARRLHSLLTELE